MNSIEIDITLDSQGYKKFRQCKKLPSYQVKGTKVYTDTESYNSVFGELIGDVDLSGGDFLFPFQKDLCKRALEMKRYALWLDCGLGKTPISLAYANSIAQKGKVLILCPLAVLDQYIEESKKFIGYDLINLRERKSSSWEDGIAICNYEGMRNFDKKGLKGIVLDESSILKNVDAKTSKWLIDLASGIEYKLAQSATPAPNDITEYATHSVWLEYYMNVNSFYSKYFINDCKIKKGSKWRLKGHARSKFYEDLAKYAVYLQRPSELGYTDTTEMKEDPKYLIEHCKAGISPTMNTVECGLNMSLLPDAKDSWVLGELRTRKDTGRFKACMEYTEGKKTIIWCKRNLEELAFKSELDNAEIMNGNTPIEERVELLKAYRSGEVDHLISKPRVLGFGVNIPECNHMIYSGYDYSFEQFYQAVRRSHRYGRKGRLEVMIPKTEYEQDILGALMNKMNSFDNDVKRIQGLFWKGM